MNKVCLVTELQSISGSKPLNFDSIFDWTYEKNSSGTQLVHYICGIFVFSFRKNESIQYNRINVPFKRKFCQGMWTESFTF